MKGILCILICLTTLTTKSQISGLKTYYKAGEKIEYSYPNIDGDSIASFIIHSYGKSLVTGQPKSDKVIFNIPQEICSKRGLITLLILKDGQVMAEANTRILPDTLSSKSIEAYCGPKHLTTGGNDFSMIVATALDPYDNPYPTGTTLDFKSQIGNKMAVRKNDMSYFIAYDRYFSTAKSGYGALSVNYEEASSKEFRINYYPNNPVNFDLTIDRQHEYADGNQLITIQTSSIQDSEGNVMENGTFVQFTIIDTQRKITQAWSETMQGIAKVKLPAPYHETTWTISAQIPSYASAKKMELTFNKAIRSIPHKHSEKELTIGPIKSYMGQFVREGTPVYVEIKNDELFYDFLLHTSSGIAYLNFKKRFIKEGNYTAKISVANLNKSFSFAICHE